MVVRCSLHQLGPAGPNWCKEQQTSMHSYLVVSVHVLVPVICVPPDHVVCLTVCVFVHDMYFSASVHDCRQCFTTAL